MNEEELIDIMDCHGAYLLKIAYIYVTNWETAEEIVQDVFVKYYEKSAQFEGRSMLRTYLVKMTINRSKDYLRSWRYKKSLIFKDIKAPISDEVTSTFYKRLEQSEVTQAILQLKPAHREVVTYFYFEELSIKEIAELLTQSESTVKTRLHRARAVLKKNTSLANLEVLNNG